MPDPRMLELALMKTKCLCGCHQHTVDMSVSNNPCNKTYSWGYGCVSCYGGAKKPWLLDPPTAKHPQGKFGLRVQCSRCRGTGLEMSRWSRFKPCQDCGGADTIYTSESDVPVSERGRGWTPSEDAWAYVRAAKAAFPIPTEPGYATGVRSKIINVLSSWAWDNNDTDPGQAALDVVYQTLKEKP